MFSTFRIISMIMCEVIILLRPWVVVLFYRELPNSSYRSWRNSFADDALARWLLAEETAVLLLRQAVEG